MAFIGIDIGASFIKGCILDTQSFTISNILKISSPIAIRNINPKRKEFSPHEFEKKVLKIIGILSKKTEVEGLVFSTQMHGMILVNDNCKPLTNFISWQDERVFEKINEHETWMDLLQKKLKNINVLETGIKIKPGIMGATLFWLNQNNIIKKVDRPKALFLGDYIAAKISKGKIMTHSTNACGSGLFSTKKNTWDNKIIKSLGLDVEILPEVVPTNCSVGNMKIKGKSVPLFVSYGDMQTAILGGFVGLSDKKEFCLNIGTGSQISTISKLYTPKNYDIRSYFDNKYLFTFTHIPAGRALNVIINFVQSIGKDIFNKKSNVWNKIIMLSKKIENADGLDVNISFFKNNATGRFSGYINKITEANLKLENIFYGAIINMIDNYSLFFRRLGGENGDILILLGGLSRKIPAIYNLLKKKLSTETKFPPNVEETLSGLMILAVYIKNKLETVEQASIFCLKKKIVMPFNK